MPSPPLVLPEHRPTLREITGPLPLALRAAGLLAVFVLLAGAALAVRGQADPGQHVVVQRGGLAFNLRHAASLRRVSPHAGELLRLESRAAGVVTASFVVAPLRLPAYRGDVAGILPIVADADQRRLHAGHPGLEPVVEGKSRLNQVAAYTLAYRLGRSPREYGRTVLLPEPVAGARSGVRIVMTSRPGDGVANAEDVGTAGRLKLPYRSFRFGTEGP